MRSLVNYKKFSSAFTLAELLGVIVVLVVVALITFPIITSSIRNSQNKALEDTIKTIEEAAYRYSVENDLGYSSQRRPLYLDEIKQKGFLKKNLVNPITEEEITGCVWYSWNIAYNQYFFEYDSECVNVDTEPTINLAYNQNLINSNGWAKENMSVTLTGNGQIKYCISNSECTPNLDVTVGNNTKFITSEGNNYLCAISSNSLGTTEKKCLTVKLDKTAPTAGTITFIGELGNDNWYTSDVTMNIVDGTDSLSGHDKTVSSMTNISNNTTGTNVVVTTTDLAGNISTNTYTVKIDKNSPTLPTIIGGSDSWSTSVKAISIETPSTSTSGIKNYQYYISTSSTSQTGGNWIDLANGTTSVNIDTNGTRYIYFRAINNAGKVSDITAPQTTKIDTGTPTTPTITGGSTTWSSTSKTIKVSTASTSTSGIKNYQYYISTSSTSQTGGNWIDLASGATSVNVSTNGTRYIYFRAVNNAGKTSAVSGYQVTKVDTTTPALRAKATTTTIPKGYSSSPINYFTITTNYGSSGGTTTCKVGSTTVTNVRSLAVGTHTLTCTMKTGAGKTASASTTLKVVQAVYEYAYTGNYQTFTVPYTGTYTFEVWGAQGGCGFYFDSLGSYPSIDSITRVGGKGAYAKGTIKLTAGDKYYIYVGGQGVCDNQAAYNFSSLSSNSIKGGWNGGGQGGGYASTNLGGDNPFDVRIAAGGGGGATDIRTASGTWNNTTSLNSRVIVAGGGGGGSSSNVYTYANGNSTTQLTRQFYGGQGSQTYYDNSGMAYYDYYKPTITYSYISGSAGSAGTLGRGGNGGSDNNVHYFGSSSRWCKFPGLIAGGGGGGGYYGGGGGGSGYTDGDRYCNSGSSYWGSGGGGGSSYINTSLFTSRTVTAGSRRMPTQDGSSTMYGNSGNGFAKITLISIN